MLASILALLFRERFTLTSLFSIPRHSLAAGSGRKSTSPLTSLARCPRICHHAVVPAVSSRERMLLISFARRARGRAAGKDRIHRCRQGGPVNVEVCHEVVVVVDCLQHVFRLSFPCCAHPCAATACPVWEGRRHERGRLEVVHDGNALALLNGLVREVLEHVKRLRARRPHEFSVLRSLPRTGRVERALRCLPRHGGPSPRHPAEKGAAPSVQHAWALHSLPTPAPCHGQEHASGRQWE